MKFRNREKIPLDNFKIVEGSDNMKYPVKIGSFPIFNLLSLFSGRNVRHGEKNMRTSFKRLLPLITIVLLMIPELSMAEAFTVTHVDDGDTIICENRDITIRVRLVAINAPELSHSKKKDDQPFSLEAKNVLEKLVLNKVVDIKGYGLDDYNRLLAVVNSGGRNINLEMIKQGMAEVYKGSPPKGFNTDIYKKAEKEAKDSLRGIWSQGNSYVSPGQWRSTQAED